MRQQPDIGAGCLAYPECAGFVGDIREQGAVGDAVLKRLGLWRAA
jgi:hypothetical protein